MKRTMKNTVALAMLMIAAFSSGAFAKLDERKIALRKTSTPQKIAAALKSSALKATGTVTDGTMALMYAMKNPDVGAVKKLIQIKVQAGAKEGYGAAALYYAVMFGNKHRR